MIDPALQQEIELLKAIIAAQVIHPFYDSLVLYVNEKSEVAWKLTKEPDSSITPSNIPEIRELIRVNETRKIESAMDRFNYGCVFQSWDDNLWEICRLCVRNPGEPVHFLITGGNGAGKSEFAGWITGQVVMQVRGKPLMFLTDDEPKSKLVQQQKVYPWLPKKYHNERGRQPTDAETKFGWNGAGGFTENEFCIRGNVAKFRFWSAAVSSMEGPRPYMVWSDEAIPLEWLDAVGRRLLTEAEGSKQNVCFCFVLLEEKKNDPAKRFPKERIGDLMCGVHLVTWTPSAGRTDTVSKFQDNGKTIQQVESDHELLPRRNNDGEIVGGEIHPRLIYGKDPKYATRMMYAWENPIGGNWKALKKEVIEKGSKTYTRWRVYGITEKSGGTPFNNFNVQVHVRPWSWYPRAGTNWMAIDPVVSGGKCWTMSIFRVAGEQQGFIAPGDLVMLAEYPQCDDLIPGVGMPDPWCQPGGKNGAGVAGNIQHAIPGGFEFKASEIRRIWTKLEAKYKDLYPEETGFKFTVPYGNLIMDSRAANTEKENETESKTLIEWMEDCGINCVPAGRGSGAQSGEAFVAPGEQMINNLLAYDRDNCVLDEKTGYMIISPVKGRGPRLWIMEHCTNTIAALQNYPGIDNGGKSSMWKDIIDPLRYVVIADPYHKKEVTQNWTGGVRQLF